MKPHIVRLTILVALFGVMVFVSRGTSVVQAQQDSAAATDSGHVELWQDIDESTIRSSGERDIIPIAYRTLALDLAQLQTLLADAPLEAAGNLRAAEFVLALAAV